MNILEKFLELTKYTQVLGEEHELEPFLPKDVIQDEIGNYYLKIGNNDVMFACHLDTAASKKSKVTHVVDNLDTKGKQVFVSSNGKTILGADDRTGLLIMLYMIENKVEGLYYFFIGEERGTVGSSGIVRKKPKFFEDYKKCISFDRRGYGSVITKQMGDYCCSSEFGNALAAELMKNTPYKHELDPTGIYTDSAVFTDIIPECTNLSVGYFNEHSHNEYQNITYLEKLCQGVIKVNWVDLPVKREIVVYQPRYSNNNYNTKKDNKVSPKDEYLSIFRIIETVMEDLHKMECMNGFGFEPEKEMYFEGYRDETKTKSVYIHLDGSITIGDEYFIDLIDFEEKMMLYYDYDISDFYDNDDDDEDEIELFRGKEENKLVELFEENIDINLFIRDVKKLLKGKKKGYIDYDDIEVVLDKYNKTIESLVTWIFHNKNDIKKTKGLKWDGDVVAFYYEDPS